MQLPFPLLGFLHSSSFSLSLPPFPCLSLSVSLPLPLSICLCLSLSLFLCLSIYLFLCLPFCCPLPSPLHSPGSFLCHTFDSVKSLFPLVRVSLPWAQKSPRGGCQAVEMREAWAAGRPPPTTSRCSLASGRFPPLPHWPTFPRPLRLPSPFDPPTELPLPGPRCRPPRPSLWRCSRAGACVGALFFPLSPCLPLA